MSHFKYGPAGTTTAIALSHKTATGVIVQLSSDMGVVVYDNPVSMGAIPTQHGLWYFFFLITVKNKNWLNRLVLNRKQKTSLTEVGVTGVNPSLIVIRSNRTNQTCNEKVHMHTQQMFISRLNLSAYTGASCLDLGKLYTNATSK